MASPSILHSPQDRALAYHWTTGTGPTVVFLGGLRSDMEGTKALYLEAWAKERGQAFLRFDYSGHGESSGQFEVGCIGDWAEDTRAMLDHVPGPLILVGSSMGGWQALLAARAMVERVVGLVTIAAAPDFTEDGMWSGFSAAEQRQVMEDGQIALPSDYGDPMIVTRRLIEDGRNNLVLRSPLHLSCPTRCLQGTADAAVDQSVALRLLEHVSGPDVRLTLVKGVDHRFSTPECLAMIVAAVEEVLSGAGEVVS